MSDQTEILIEKVRKYTYLYDTSHEFYKNVFKKAEAWNEIAEELNITSESAKTKWKNLRDSYMKFKKSLNGETGLVKKYGKWPWSSHMSFLDPTLQIRPQSSNITKPSVETEDRRPSSPISLSPVTKNDDEWNEIPLSPEIPPPYKKKKKLHGPRRNVSSDSEVDKVIDFLKNSRSRQKELDGVDHLFLSYAETFKKFRPRTQAMFKLKLATLFSETELNELQEH